MKTFTLFAGIVLSASLSLADDPPNFVIILADDMGYGDASCYGNTRYKTPHLDRMAKGGLRFLDFHSSCPVCSPTRAGLVTGRYQQRAGIPGVVKADPKQNRHHGLHGVEVTFAELLKQKNYSTALCGKWHLGYRAKFNPTKHGFDSFRGYVSGNVDYISHRDQTGVHDWWHNAKNTAEEGYSTHLITKHAVSFLRKNHKKPFCLYVAHEAPHYPYQGPNDPPIRTDKGTRITRGDNIDVQRAYKQMMQEMDKGIGEILDTLEQLKVAKNTLVFFFSDNGGTRHGRNGPLRGFKGSCWEGGHRVPAIAYWPGKIKPGTTNQTCISLDLMPTMLQLANVKPSHAKPLDGVSLVPVLRGKPLGKRTLFWEFNRQAGVRDGDWKLVVTKGRRGGKGGTMLFNLKNDISEKNDLAKPEAARRDALFAKLEKWRKDVATGATQQPAKP